MNAQHRPRPPADVATDHPLVASASRAEAASPRGRWRGPAWLSPAPLNVAPGLIGQPLGTPARRAWALGLDLLAVALLSSLSNLWLLGGLGLVVLLLRSDRGSTRWRRGVGWVFAAVLLLLALEQLLIWRGWHPFQDDTPPVAAAAAWPPGVAASAPAASAADIGRRVAAQVVGQVAPRHGAGASADAPRRIDAEDLADAAAEQAAAAAEAELTRSTRALTLKALGVPARAASATDAERAQQLEDHLLAQGERAEEAGRAATRNFSLKRWLDDSLDSLGVSFAWGIVYFSLLPALWGGQTLGKKLLGLRVVELTGQPITVMRALRRYGGYAAGMATGGLGFLQLLWDPNRQGIQDRTAHTVVLDVRASAQALGMAAAATALAAAAVAAGGAAGAPAPADVPGSPDAP